MAQDQEPGSEGPPKAREASGEDRIAEPGADAPAEEAPPDVAPPADPSLEPASPPLSPPSPGVEPSSATPETAQPDPTLAPPTASGDISAAPASTGSAEPPPPTEPEAAPTAAPPPPANGQPSEPPPPPVPPATLTATAAGPPSPPGEAPPPTADPAGRPKIDRRWQLAFFVVLVALLGMTAFLIARDDDEEPAQQAGATTTTTTSPEQAIPADWATYEDEEAGFSLRHPPDWEVLAGPNPPGPLADAIGQRVVLSPGGGEAVKVQAGRLPVQIESEEAAKIQADQIYNRLIAPDVVLSHQQGPFTSHGMPGYFYTYSFRDAASGGQGLHLHYFLFRGNVIYSIVFQALPADLAKPEDLERFGQLAPVFVRMAESFKSDL